MSDMGSGGQTATAWNPIGVQKILTEGDLCSQLAARLDLLDKDIAEHENFAAELPGLRSERVRVEKALAALNAVDSVTATPEMFLCGYCPRDFTTRRGLARHEHAAHPGAGGSQSLLDGS